MERDRLTWNAPRSKPWAVRLWGITMAKYVVCRYTHAMQMHINSNYKNHDFSKGSLFM